MVRWMSNVGYKMYIDEKTHHNNNKFKIIPIEQQQPYFKHNNTTTNHNATHFLSDWAILKISQLL